MGLTSQGKKSAKDIPVNKVSKRICKNKEPIKPAAKKVSEENPETAEKSSNHSSEESGKKSSKKLDKKKLVDRSQFKNKDKMN